MNSLNKIKNTVLAFGLLIFHIELYSTDNLIHDFTLLSPNDEGGVVEGVDNEPSTKSIYTIENDPGLANVPGINKEKVASSVGKVEFTGVSPVWYEVFPTPINFNNFDKIGFFIRVATDTGQVPVIIKSGIGAGKQSLVTINTTHIQGDTALRTDWRWIEIPITDFVGNADLSIINTIQVARVSNSSGTFFTTTWNTNFWIDDLILLAPASQFNVTLSTPVGSSFIVPNGTATINVKASVTQGGNVSVGQNIDFTIKTGTGQFTGNTTVTTDASGEAIVTYQSSKANEIVEVVATVNGTQNSGAILLQQGIIENFENGVLFNGIISFFGEDVEGTKTATERLVDDILTANNKIALLQTDADGFADSTNSRVIGISKKFSQPISINTSLVNEVRYSVRSDNLDGIRTVAIELVIGDGGDDGDANNGNETGSTWIQKSGQQLSLINLNGKEFIENAVSLLNGFVVSNRPTDTNTTDNQLPVANFDLSNINGFNILMIRNSGSSGERTLFVDNIILAKSPVTITTNPSIIVPNGQSTTVVNANLAPFGNALAGKDVIFEILTGGGLFTPENSTQTTVTSDASGNVSATYQAGTEPGVVVIKISNTEFALQSLAFIYQGVIENFESRLGGAIDLAGFGNDLGSGTINSDQSRSGNSSFQLQLDADGFEATALRAIGVSKTFDSVIDLSNFTDVQYWVKSDLKSSDVTEKPNVIDQEAVVVAIELIEGAGGVNNGSGSTWRQLALRQIEKHLTGLDSSKFNQIKIPFSEFFKVQGDTTATSLNSTLLSNISGINIIVSNNLVGTPQFSVYIDDISFGIGGGDPSSQISFAQWRLENFIPQRVNNDAFSGRNSDPDSDLISNEEEYIFGSKPDTPDSPPILFNRILNNKYELLFNTNVRAGDINNFILEGTLDFSIWTPAGITPSLVSENDKLRSYKIEVDAGNDSSQQKFTRLKFNLN